MKRKRAQVQQKEQYDPRFPSNVINIDHRLNEKRRRAPTEPATKRGQDFEEKSFATARAASALSFDTS